MESFLVSLSTVALAEIGDRTQILTLVLAARYRKPWPILAGILFATLANHILAAFVGVYVGRYLTPRILDGAVGVSLIGMAIWTLKPEKAEAGAAATRRASAFVATFATIFLAEMGDKTQIATIALAAAYSNLAVVVAGTTTGMMLVNTPVVFFGKLFSDRLPLRAINYTASALFLVIGGVFLARALR